MKKNSFIEGALIATLSIVIVKILGILYVIPFYKIIGTEGAALYSYAYNVYLLFLNISSLGIPIAISKIISEYNTDGYFEAKQRVLIVGRRIVGVISLLAFLVLFIFAEEVAMLILGDLQGGTSIKDIAFTVRCTSLAVLIIPYLSITRGYLQGHKYISPSSISQILEQIVRIIVVLCGSYLVYKIFDGSLSLAVGVSLTGAFFGGIAAYIYLICKIKKNKKKLNINSNLKKDNITNKEILKKIVKYAVPFIIIYIATSLYNLVDMILILRTLNFLGFNVHQVEFIATSISTWGAKVGMIVTAIATGLTTSLIPNIVSSFVSHNLKDVNKKINRAFQIVLIVSIPLVIGISFLATPIWTIFYGYNELGTSVLAFSIFTSLFGNLYFVVASILQAMNKFKTVYISYAVGFIANLTLDIPLMIIFYKLGLPAYYGAPLASMIGYSLTVFIGLYIIKKDHEFNYRDIFNKFIRMLLPTVCMFIILLLLKLFIPINNTNRLISLLITGIYGLIGALVYLIIAYKMNLFNEIFGKETIKRILKRFTFGLVNLKD